MMFGTGSKNPRWSSGITRDGKGYLAVYVGSEHPLADSKGYCRLHVLVVAAAGIPVKPGDDRHHDNEDKDDNRLRNLVVMDHAEHSRQHAAKQPRESGQFAPSTTGGGL